MQTRKICGQCPGGIVNNWEVAIEIYSNVYFVYIITSKIFDFFVQNMYCVFFSLCFYLVLFFLIFLLIFSVYWQNKPILKKNKKINKSKLFFVLSTIWNKQTKKKKNFGKFEKKITYLIFLPKNFAFLTKNTQWLVYIFAICTSCWVFLSNFFGSRTWEIFLFFRDLGNFLKFYIKNALQIYSNFNTCKIFSPSLGKKTKKIKNIQILDIYISKNLTQNNIHIYCFFFFFNFLSSTWERERERKNYTKYCCFFFKIFTSLGKNTKKTQQIYIKLYIFCWVFLSKISQVLGLGEIFVFYFFELRNRKKIKKLQIFIKNFFFLMEKLNLQNLAIFI